MIHRQEFEDNLTKELLSRLSIAIYKLPFAQDCLLLRTSVPQGCSPEHKWVLSVWLSVWYMSWADHVDAISMKINQRIGLIRRIRNLLPLQARVALYNALILPLFDYGDVIWGDKNNDTIMSELQILQNKAAKVMLGQPPRSSSTEALKSLDLKSLSTRRFFHCCTAIHKCLIGETDFNFNFTKSQAVHSYNTRRSNDIRLPLPRTNWGKQTFIFHAAKDWNSLPNDLKECNILSIFKSKLKTFLKDLS